MDISIKSEEGKFKFRVCGILEYDGKYLFVCNQCNCTADTFFEFIPQLKGKGNRNAIIDNKILI